MQYKMIALALIQENPEIYERLRRGKTLRGRWTPTRSN